MNKMSKLIWFALQAKACIAIFNKKHVLGANPVSVHQIFIYIVTIVCYALNSGITVNHNVIILPMFSMIFFHP